MRENLRCHSSLQALGIYNAALDTVTGIGAVVGACIALSLRTLILVRCRVVPAVLPHLIRLIAAGALRELVLLSNEGVEMFGEAHESTRLFVAAVRASAVTRLSLINMGVITENVAEAAAFINARQQ